MRIPELPGVSNVTATSPLKKKGRVRHGTLSARFAGASHLTARLIAPPLFEAHLPEAQLLGAQRYWPAALSILLATFTPLNPSTYFAIPR